MKAIPDSPQALSESLCSFLNFCLQATATSFSTTPDDCQKLTTILLTRHIAGDYAGAVRTWCEFWDSHQRIVVYPALRSLSTEAVMQRIEAALTQHCGRAPVPVVEETLECGMTQFERGVYAFLCNISQAEPARAADAPRPEYVKCAKELSNGLLGSYPSKEVAREELPKLWQIARDLIMGDLAGDNAHPARVHDDNVMLLKQFYTTHCGVAPALIGADWGSDPSTSKEVLVSVSPESTICFNLPLSVTELQQFFQDGGKFPVNLMVKVSQEHRRQLMKQAVEALQGLVITTATEFFTNSFFDARASMGLSAGTDHLRSVLLPLMDYLARPQIKVQEVQILNSTRTLLDVIDTLLAAEATEHA